MKKRFILILCLLIIALFAACRNSSEFNNVQNKTETDNNTSEVQTVEHDYIRENLCDGKWFVNTNGEPIIGEGRYIDYIAFHQDSTYETKMVLWNSSQIGIYDILDDVLIIHDYYGIEYYGDENGEYDSLIHIDCAFKINNNVSSLTNVGYFIRYYDLTGNVKYVIEEDTYKEFDSLKECVNNLPDVEEETVISDFTKLSDEIHFNVLSKSFVSPDGISVVFSNDGYCYLWNANIRDYDFDVYSVGHEVYKYYFKNNTIVVQSETQTIYTFNLQIDELNETYLVDFNTNQIYN